MEKANAMAEKKKKDGEDGYYEEATESEEKEEDEEVKPEKEAAKKKKSTEETAKKKKSTKVTAKKKKKSSKEPASGSKDAKEPPLGDILDPQMQDEWSICVHGTGEPKQKELISPSLSHEFVRVREQLLRPVKLRFADWLWQTCSEVEGEDKRARGRMLRERANHGRGYHEC